MCTVTRYASYQPYNALKSIFHETQNLSIQQRTNDFRFINSNSTYYYLHEDHGLDEITISAFGAEMHKHDTGNILEGHASTLGSSLFGGRAMYMWPLYKVSGMSRDNVVRTRYFHYVYDLSTCLHVKIAALRGLGAFTYILLYLLYHILLSQFRHGPYH